MSERTLARAWLMFVGFVISASMGAWIQRIIGGCRP